MFFAVFHPLGYLLGVGPSGVKFVFICAAPVVGLFLERAKVFNWSSRA